MSVAVPAMTTRFSASIPQTVFSEPRGDAASLRVTGIPAQLTSFVGREKEIDTIRRLLSSTRLLSLTGSGGSGKTRLAVEIVSRESAVGRHAGAWVDLAPVRDASLVADAVLDATGVRDDEGQQGPADRLARFIAARPFLLVLDNCEHLVDACAALADGLLRTCPELRVIATTREALGVTAETAWLVPPLSLPEADGRSAEQSEAVQLFIDRARAVVPGFELDVEHRAAISQICRRLDGLPLALELAAARLRVLTPEQIASRLDDRFKLLKTGNRSALARHQTLRAAIDWSYDLLDAEAKILLARLSVFGGGFTLEAAEAVCAGGEIPPDDVLDLVSELVEKSLVEMREAGDTARYRLLETVRQYANERLVDRAEAGEGKERHAEFFFSLVAEAEPHMLTSRRPAWVDRLQPELDNVRQTLAWSRDGDPELHMRLVGSMHWFWFSTGQWPEARSWLRSALTLGEISDRPTRDRAAVLFSAGSIASLQGRNESSQVHLIEAQRLAQELGDRRLEAYVRSYRALAFTTINSHEAEDHLEMAHACFKEAGDLYGLRLTFLLMGSQNLVKGNLAKAVEYGEEGVRVARVFGLERELAIALQTLGVFLSHAGEMRRATALIRESLEAMRRDPQLLFLSRSLEMLAWSMLEQGVAEPAATLYGAAEGIRETIGAKMWQVDRERHTPRIEAARRTLGEETFEAARKLGRAMGVIESLDFALDAAAKCPAFNEEEPTTNTAEYMAVRVEKSASAALRVSALGSLEVSVDGAPISPKAWGYAKARELMLFLLLHPDGRTRDQVGAALWPDASSAQVRNNFHVTAHHLRKALGRADWLRFDRDRYQINAGLGGVIDFDAATFERQVGDELRRARRGQINIDSLRAALATYRSAFADGEPYGDWHLEVRDQLGRLHADGLETLGEALLKAERYDEAAGVFERLIRQEELHEDAYRALMICRARAGDRTAAMREYRRLESMVRKELESEPSKETSALFKKLQRGEAI